MKIKKRELEVLMNLKEQGFMPDLSNYENNIIEQQEGIIKSILTFGFVTYFNLIIGDFYLPLAKVIIEMEDIK